MRIYGKTQRTPESVLSAGAFFPCSAARFALQCVYTSWREVSGVKEIASVHNSTVQALRELQKTRGRREAGLFIAEGGKLVGEALALGLCRTLLVQADRLSQHEQLVRSATDAGCDVLSVSAAVMQAVCETKTPQGVACAAAIPPQAQMLDGSLLVALDGVQDPGNVGTIVRTADAAGFDGVLLGEGCADLYSPKALRATMGSALRMRVLRTDDLPGELEGLKRRGYAVAATELGGEDFYARCPRRHAVLVIGSEGRGVSQAVRDTATHHLALPMRGGAESLNAAVAAGIMMYEMAREI